MRRDGLKAVPYIVRRPSPYIRLKAVPYKRPKVD